VDPNIVTVRIVGTGRMGGAMATTLQESGFDLVVWNRTTSKAEELAAGLGARVATGPDEVARLADLVVCSLSDDAALRSVYGDAGGIVGGSR